MSRVVRRSGTPRATNRSLKPANIAPRSSPSRPYSKIQLMSSIMRGSGSDLSAQLSRRLFPICGEDCGNCSKCSGGPGDGKPSRSAGSGASSRKRLWQLNPA